MLADGSQDGAARECWGVLYSGVGCGRSHVIKKMNSRWMDVGAGLGIDWVWTVLDL